MSNSRLSLYGGIAVPYAFQQFAGPSAFLFTPFQGATLEQADIESNIITLGGITGDALAVSISGDASATYSKNNSAFVSSATTAVNGDTFQLRLTASASYNTTVQAVLTVGEVVGTFLVTTIRDPNAVVAVSFLSRLHSRR